MILEIIKQFNWLDIFVVIILIRTIYVSFKNGFFVTLFNLLGVVFACYLSLHYFARLGDFCSTYIPTPPRIPLEIWDAVAFIVLGMVGYAIFIILRATFFRFIKAEAVSLLNKWGAAILGFARGLLLVSLIIFFLSVPVIDYFVSSAKRSFFGKELINVSVTTYTFLWDKMASKFFPQDKFNQAVWEVRDEVLQR